MGKTLRYVKDFDFSSAGKTVGYCMGGRVKKAEGGVIKAAKPAAAKQYAAEKANITKERTPKVGSGMVEKAERLGVVGNKNPGIARKSVPVAPRQPMIAAYAKGGYAEGGKIPKAGAYKVPKVMTEFKSGELHSGSKTGPVVKSRKQAIAIALSEARAAGKKK